MKPLATVRTGFRRPHQHGAYGRSHEAGVPALHDLRLHEHSVHHRRHSCPPVYSARRRHILHSLLHFRCISKGTCTRFFVDWAGKFVADPKSFYKPHSVSVSLRPIEICWATVGASSTSLFCRSTTSPSSSTSMKFWSKHFRNTSTHIICGMESFGRHDLLL